MWYASGGHASPPHILDEYVVIPLPHSDTGRSDCYKNDVERVNLHVLHCH